MATPISARPNANSGPLQPVIGTVSAPPASDRHGVGPSDQDQGDRPRDQKRHESDRPDLHIPITKPVGQPIAVQLQTEPDGDDQLMDARQRD
jgi:hypothetical protein